MVSSTVAGAKLPFGNCRIRPAFTTLMSVGVHAAVGAVGIGEIALLQGEAPEIVTRHGADLVQLADQEVGKRLWRLVLSLRLVDSMLRLVAGVLLRLMHGMSRSFVALRHAARKAQCRCGEARAP